MLKTTPYDFADYLTSESSMAIYLDVALESGNPAFLAAALGDIVRAQGGIAKMAAKIGLTRAGLTKALSKKGNPELATVMKVADALGCRLRVTPKPHTRGRAKGSVRSAAKPSRRKAPAAGL